MGYTEKQSFINIKNAALYSLFTKKLHNTAY